MTQLFDEKGDIVPVTVIEAGPCTVTEIRTSERDGYTALQLGFGTNKEKRFTKPVLGQSLNAAVFEKGEHVDVEGTTKGRGFAGIIKRHGFKGGHASHGPTMGREPGSIGSSAYPSRVIKGKRLPGRMGGKPLTIKNLVVAGVDAEQNVLLLRGAIPGPPNGLVYVLK